MLDREKFKNLVRFKKKGLNKNQIAKRLGVSYPTVSKYWEYSLKDFDLTTRQYYEKKHLSRAEVYRDDLLELIKNDSEIPAYKIYSYIKEKYGFDPVVGQKTLAKYYQKLKKT